METLMLLISGAAGALVRDVLKDNALSMPKFENGSLVLGFLGGLVIGACAGYLIDGQPSTAFLGGFTGYQILTSLIPKDER